MPPSDPPPPPTSPPHAWPSAAPSAGGELPPPAGPATALPAPPSEVPPLGPAGHIPGDPRKWGLVEPLLGMILALVASVVVVQIVFGVSDYDEPDDWPMWLTSMVNLPLQVTLIIVALGSAYWLGRGPISDYRLDMDWRDIPRGIVYGVGAQFVLGFAVTLPFFWIIGRDLEEAENAARDLTDRADSPISVIALVVTVAIMAPIAEELFYRGLLFGGFRKRNNGRFITKVLPPKMRPDLNGTKWNAWYAAIANGVLFAIVHPDPYLWPTLGILGIFLARLVERYGRLSIAVWTHLGFNTLTVINLLLLN